MGAVYASTVTRIASYKFVLLNNDPNFQMMPVHALNNDGHPIEIRYISNTTIPDAEIDLSVPPAVSECCEASMHFVIVRLAAIVTLLML